MSNIAPTWANLIAAYPAFGTAAFATLGPLQLAISIRLLSQTAWGDFWSDAILLDCAHNLLLNNLAASGGGLGAVQMAAGPISSTSVAGTSTSFNTVASDGKGNSRDWYRKTVYGQQFLRLQDVVITPGFCTTGSTI